MILHRRIGNEINVLIISLHCPNTERSYYTRVTKTESLFTNLDEMGKLEKFEFLGREDIIKKGLMVGMRYQGVAPQMMRLNLLTSYCIQLVLLLCSLSNFSSIVRDHNINNKM